MAKVRRPPAAPIRQRLDVYVSHASQLVAADQAHESVERIVGTISLALTSEMPPTAGPGYLPRNGWLARLPRLPTLAVLLDMLRAGAGADACPHISLGTHLAGVRELPGVPTATLFYQGLCFYAGSDTFEGVANGVEPYDFVAAGCSPERNMVRWGCFAVVVTLLVLMPCKRRSEASALRPPPSPGRCRAEDVPSRDDHRRAEEQTCCH